MAKLELYYPTKPFTINQYFGDNATDVYKKLGMKGHNGLDLWAPDGWIIRAAHDGTVTYAGEDGSSGLLVVIRTDEAYDYAGEQVYFKTLYAHLKKGFIQVKPSQKVKTGDIIALADNTGLSTGSHLHFGLKPILPGEADWQWFNYKQDNGYNGAIDPLPYFTGIYAEYVASLHTKVKELLAKLKSLWKK